MMYDIIVSESLRFRLSTRKRWANIFPNLHSGHRFQKPTFLVPKNAVYIRGQKANTEKTNMFSKISRYMWTGPE